ncbi:MAG: DEAD/DEAH box helicase [Candidatus Thermoplasmatota archaeon]|nr:DEAD/DEAH box helicase [Euryarchaeota archaeon]MBU4032189.1 DEAD/DEAH box helicase [Candidatus Thermoplasmatota archaeon]MBU4071965.1 DEAD/DEAH box helicase [Candidatus Thermoplasmatota archaeon]MBU4143921.1 DEAD/DEAH box helicase [Candidatus Thermoplasmatota archaeon]MBU4591673.1 DEAD/DEAH box helicase [Candidatus Thermoplasmatota archaeon]
MKVDELDIDRRVIDLILSKGISEFYPPQADALKQVLEGRNVVLAIPTASGKSLVAYIGILKRVLEGKKALYIVPLRALASEKYDELKEFESLGLKVGKTVGDFDAPDPELQKLDIIVATSERADSLMRHRSDWMYEIGVVVADEVHLINDASRGPTLEVTLVRLRELNPNAQFIALSATIKNSIELADWLHARHIKSDWRPVALKEGVYLDGKIRFTDSTKKEIEFHKDDISSLVCDTVKDGGQILVFVNTRKSSESVAERVAKVLQKSILGDAELAALGELAGRLEGTEEEPTSTGARLADCVRGGTAFHNAGLTDGQRRMVENSFRDRAIKCIVATPTLAAGINLPARRVVVRDTTRYDSNYGNVPIPVMEIKQMCGRAGRPQFDPYGEAVLVARGRSAMTRLMEDYLLGESEAISSKLGTENALRSHILATIATGYAKNREELMTFMDKSFFAHQTDVWTIEGMIDRILEFLEHSDLIAVDFEDFKATMFGKRTSDLYIDPLSAVMMKAAIDRSETVTTNELALLQICSSTPDVYPLYLRKPDMEWVPALAQENSAAFLVDIPVESTEEYDMFLSSLKTASLLQHWMAEVPENRIVDKFGVGPGDVRSRVDSADWMLYSMRELARLFGSPLTGMLNSLVLRVRYGIKEELLPLASLKNIGRKRSRTLYDAGITSISRILETDFRDLDALPGIGPQLAASLKEQARRLA